jgi:mono/diheme cytochrome c family protein
MSNLRFHVRRGHGGTVARRKAKKDLRVSVSPWLRRALIAMTLLTATTLSAQEAPKGNAENGRHVYLRTGCYQCHGREGQGSPTTGPRLGPSTSPWRPFEQYVRRPRGDMPPYSAQILTDAELADIYAYLRSRPRPPAVTTIPF